MTERHFMSWAVNTHHLTIEGSWPAGHCRHTHPSSHRHCTAAVPPQPSTWRTHTHTHKLVSDWTFAASWSAHTRCTCHTHTHIFTVRRTRAEQQRWFLIFFNVFFYVHMICRRRDAETGVTSDTRVGNVHDISRLFHPCQHYVTLWNQEPELFTAHTHTLAQSHTRRSRGLKTPESLW